MKKILVPVDFSETSINALEQALLVAQASKGEVNLLNVVKKGASFSSFFSSSQKAPLLSEEEAREKLSSLVDQYSTEGKGVKMTYECRKGNIEDQIDKYCEEIEADLICMGTHGVTGFKEFWMGSNAYRIVSLASVPVLTLRKNVKANDLQKIVMPIDMSRNTRHKVPQTIQIAKLFRSTIHIVGLPSNNQGELFTKVKNYVGQVTKFIEDKGIECRSEMLPAENPSKATLGYAEKIDANLISIMTEQEFDPSAIIVGPYAQQMVNHSQFPVLTSRPSEYLRGSASVFG